VLRPVLLHHLLKNSRPRSNAESKKTITDRAHLREQGDRELDGNAALIDREMTLLRLRATLLHGGFLSFPCREFLHPIMDED